MARRPKINTNVQKTSQLSSTTKNLHKKKGSNHLQQSHIIGTNRKKSLNNNSSNPPSTSTKISNLPNTCLTIVQPSILRNKKSETSKLIDSTTIANNDSKLKNFPLLASTETITSTHNLNTLNTPLSKKKKQSSKTGKGLRHFSMKVCEKVKMKGITTYNEVADELVSEFYSTNISLNKSLNNTFQSDVYNDQETFDQKNIRRRVYDALNVLMAMNIISKEKKEIRWIGLPSNSNQEFFDLEQEKQDRLKRIKTKKQQLHDLLLQQIAFKNLVERNRKFNLLPTPNATIDLPFIIVNTDKTTIIDCSISSDKSEYLFNFDNTFEIHDDIEVLKRMGLTHGLECEDNENIDKDGLKKAKTMLPEALKNELDEIIQQNEMQLLIDEYQIS